MQPRSSGPFYSWYDSISNSITYVLLFNTRAFSFYNNPQAISVFPPRRISDSVEGSIPSLCASSEVCTFLEPLYSPRRIILASIWRKCLRPYRLRGLASKFAQSFLNFDPFSQYHINTSIFAPIVWCTVCYVNAFIAFFLYLLQWNSDMWGRKSNSDTGWRVPCLS